MDIQTDPHMKHWREIAIRDGYHSAAAVPIWQGGKIVGLLNLYAGDIGFFLSQQEQSLLEEMGLDISFALDTLQKEAERKRAEEEVRVNKAKLETALASMTDAIFISDMEGRFIDFNEAFAIFHKFKNKNECANTLAEYPEFLDVFLPSGELAPLEQWAIPRALRGETVTNAEYGLRRKDTGETWVGSYSFAPIRDPDRVIVGSVVVARDITDRKKTEERLRRSQETYQELFENNPHPMWVYDMEILSFLMVNDAAVHHYGYSKEEFLNMTIKDIRPKEDVLNLLKNLEQHSLPLEKSTGWRHRTNDGTLIDVEVTSHALQFEDRSARLVLANDITERTRAEEALQKSEEKYRTLVELAEDVILLTDLNGKQLYRNSAYYTRLGFEVGEEVDLDGYTLVHLDDVPQMKKVTEDLMSTGTAVNEYRVQ